MDAKIKMTDIKNLMKEGANVQINDKAYPQTQLEEIAKIAREYHVNVSIVVTQLTVEQMKVLSQKAGRGITFIFDKHVA
jgi:hypothetical protein